MKAMALNILLVDDSETVRAVLAKTLQLTAIPVGELYKAPNGQAALEIMKSAWIDLIFTDINMPVMGGVEMVAAMHQDEVLKSIPVIVVSTEGSATRIEELKAYGVRAYVRKPFMPEQIRAVVEEVLGPIGADASGQE
jgi:two-component system chemotaxis response regulator CheY